VCLAHGIISKGEGLPCPLDDAGRFTAEVPDFQGQYVKVGCRRRWFSLQRLGIGFGTAWKEGKMDKLRSGRIRS
jgi:hypothetical protein